MQVRANESEKRVSDEGQWETVMIRLNRTNYAYAVSYGMLLLSTIKPSYL